MVQHLSVYLLTFLMVSRTDAYTESCEASLSTMKNVTECPTNRKSYEKAAHLKNCSSMSDSCKKGAQYHCVLNSELNGLVEVCASSINVYGSVCAKFDENLKGIIRVYDLECQNFSTPCPISYNSTETYKYPECSDVHYTHTSYLTSTISENFGITKNILISARHDQQNVVSIVLGVLFPVLALFSGIVIVIFLRSRNFLCFKTENRNGNQVDGIEVPGIFPNNVVEEETELKPLLTAQENNVKAVVKIDVSTEAQDKRKLLEVALNFLIESLKTPDEGWTKKSIIEQVDNTINNIREVGDRELLTEFITKLTEDPDIQGRLIPCGSEMYQLLLSVQEKYDAAKCIVDKGCFCVVLYFDDDKPLQKFVNDFQLGDKDLIRCISRILLNKNFLGIFQIYPEIVTWKASTVKVYKGSELRQEVNLKRSLVGTYKGTTEDDHDEVQIVSESPMEVTPLIPDKAGAQTLKTDIDVQIPVVSESPKEVTPLIPDVAGSPALKADIDGKLEEKHIFDDFHASSNKYPAYQHVKTRKISFESCEDSSIKKKALEFARDGFYYEGYGLVTTCFHCGIQKDDWKKEDNIHAEHVKLNQACDFVKYVQLHILRTK